MIYYPIKMEESTIDNKEDYEKQNNVKEFNENFSDNEIEKAENEVSAKLFWFKIFVIVFILLCLVISFIFYEDLKRQFLLFTKFLKEHIVVGSIVLIGIKVIGTILYVPGVLLAIGVGYAYNQIYKAYYISVPLGVFIYFIGSCIGCTCAFFLARNILQDCLRPKLIDLKYFRALDRAITSNGKKVNFLLRSTPLVPYNVVNYFLGITHTTYVNYLFGLIGFIPLICLYIFLGTTIEDLSSMKSTNSTIETVILVMSIILSLVCIVIITKIAKNELDKELKHIKKEEIN